MFPNGRDNGGNGGLTVSADDDFPYHLRFTVTVDASS